MCLLCELWTVSAETLFKLGFSTEAEGLFCGQAQNGVNLEFDLRVNLEGQGRSLHKTIWTLTKLFCTFGPNLVVLTWTGPELSCGQASDWHTDWHTDTHTDTGNDNNRRPKLASGKTTASIFIQENDFEKAVSNFSAILFRPSIYDMWKCNAIYLKILHNAKAIYCHSK